MPSVSTERLTIDRLNDDGCIALLERFLRVLSKDYTQAYINFLNFPHSPDVREHYCVLKDLITSQYFNDLTNLDGQVISEGLERRVRMASRHPPSLCASSSVG